MEENRINLVFDKLIADLAGNPLGRKTFHKQVEPYFLEGKRNVIVIPENINDVGSSFVQGMYSSIGEKYGKSRALEMMQFDCENSRILEKIDNSIRTYGI